MIKIFFILVILAVLSIGCSKSTDDLINDLYSDNPRTKRKAATLLGGKRGDTETVRKLIDLLDKDNTNVAFIAIQILGGLSDTTAVEPISRMLNNPNKYLRVSACWSLGSIGHESAMPYLVNTLEYSVSDDR